jgi:hypothetical protein
MNTSGVLRGVSLAVPAATMARIAKTLVEHGRVRRGYLGVGVQPARLAKPYGSSGQTTGLLIASVEDGSPAEKGGLFLGDVLLTMGGKPLAAMDDLLSALAGDVVGQSAALEVMRGGKVSSIRLRSGAPGAGRGGGGMTAPFLEQLAEDAAVANRARQTLVAVVQRARRLGDRLGAWLGRYERTWPDKSVERARGSGQALTAKVRARRPGSTWRPRARMTSARRRSSATQCAAHRRVFAVGTVGVAGGITGGAIIDPPPGRVDGWPRPARGRGIREGRLSMRARWSA